LLQLFVNDNSSNERKKVKELDVLKYKDPLETVFEAIVTSSNKCPKILKELLNYIFELCSIKFGDETSRYLGVTSCLFLRFFTPAIKSPMYYGISTIQPTNKLCKVSNMISNIIQKISNFCIYEIDHEYKILNTYIENNFGRLKEFIDQLVSDTFAISNTILNPINDIRRDYQILIDIFQNNRDQIKQLGKIIDDKDEGTYETLFTEIDRINTIITNHNENPITLVKSSH